MKRKNIKFESEHKNSDVRFQSVACKNFWNIEWL